jgi:hypothetical protein
MSMMKHVMVLSAMTLHYSLGTASPLCKLVACMRQSLFNISEGSRQVRQRDKRHVSKRTDLEAK